MPSCAIFTCCIRIGLNLDRASSDGAKLIRRVGFFRYVTTTPMLHNRES